MVITYLEQALEEINYDSIGEWCIADLEEYSIDKKLFNYQIEAVKNAIKVLYSYYCDENNGKETLYDMCIAEGMKPHMFDVKEFYRNKPNAKFDRLTKNNSYPISKYNDERIVDEKEFFNRMCFWMATASGKTLLIVKMIEVIDKLQKEGQMPSKEMLVLFPSEKIQNQFAEAVDEYNVGKERIIKLRSLKDYDNRQYNSVLKNEITVYSYRSDLFSEVDKTKKIDSFTYDNNGNWYIFLDEAHKGEKKGDSDDSLRQDYISIMSRNGFLFNFSATFTDNLDYSTTCFNFNLEKFIQSGYGKNIYLCDSVFNFVSEADDITEREKQLQVLKSLITLTMVKKSKKEGYYHNPLMVTLVNEVNTEDSDTDMFFTEIAKIAKGEIDEVLFETAKEELIHDYTVNTEFQFGHETLVNDDNQISGIINEISIKDILHYVYNSSSHGQIEVIEGEPGKEFALQLKTSDKPFALFRIGDASQYINEKLNDDYLILDTFETKYFFDGLNEEDSDFNILIGSRMFYEGWDSNRPNVMNFINIGTGDSKKYVLQSLGRGVRIEPATNNRKRLKANDSNKEQLLETLFVFATNKNAINTILETMESQKSEERTIVFKEAERPFDLLIPYYEESERSSEFAKFNISKESYNSFKKYVKSFSDELLLILTDAKKTDIDLIRAAMQDKNILFNNSEKHNYTNMKALLEKIIKHISVNDKCVGGLKELEEEIVHFKHVKIEKEKWNNDETELIDFIEQDSNQQLAAELVEKLQAKEISQSEFAEKYSTISENEKSINGVEFIKLAHHYYLPLAISKSGKLSYIKHIIDVESEIEFVKNLIDYIDGETYKYDWMFSKIDQTVDDKAISMPYFNNKDNKFHVFYPDFIFWQKKGKEYRITFVDPKGTEYSSYLSKVDYFKEMFIENSKPKEFKYRSYTVTFALKLAYDEDGTIPDEYKEFWIGNNDFSWIE